MLRKECVGLAFVLALGFQAPLFAEALSVVHAEAPQFTEVAVKARLSGTVQVGIRIDPAGNVIGSSIEKDLPMSLGKSAQEAAWHWKFSASAGREAREALLTFIFEPGGSTAEPGHTEVSFAGPLTLRIGYIRSTVLWLPREKGEIPPRYCPVHGEAMAVEQVEIRGGLPSGRTVDETPEGQRREAERRAYEDALAEAQRTLFPESNWAYEVGCVMPQETRAEVYYCPACRDAEKAWRESHPVPKAPGEAEAADESDTPSSPEIPPQR